MASRGKVVYIWVLDECIFGNVCVRDALYPKNISSPHQLYSTYICLFACVVHMTHSVRTHMWISRVCFFLFCCRPKKTLAEMLNTFPFSRYICGKISYLYTRERIFLCMWCAQCDDGADSCAHLIYTHTNTLVATRCLLVLCVCVCLMGARRFLFGWGARKHATHERRPLLRWWVLVRILKKTLRMPREALHKSCAMRDAADGAEGTCGPEDVRSGSANCVLFFLCAFFWSSWEKNKQLYGAMDLGNVKDW